MRGQAMNATRRISLDPANVAAFDAWNGPDGDYWASNADTFDASLARYRRAFLDATRIAPTDRVLDIGCGNGRSTLDVARLSAHGFVIGIDLSARMLDVARRRAFGQHVTNVEFLQADAQIHRFAPASFDAATSHTGAMFFGDPAAAFTNIARAMCAGAPLTLLVWQSPQANDWFGELTGILAAGRRLPAPVPGAPGPFSLADPDRARHLLEANGFDNVNVDGLYEPMWFGNTTDDAVAFVSGLGVFDALLRDLEPEARDAASADLLDSIGAHRARHGVEYPSAMWLVTATRR
jgi:SAM-dependent methyltransferase